VGAAGSRVTGSCRGRPGNWAPYDSLYRRLTGSRACTNDPPAADAIAPLPIVVDAPPRYERLCSPAAQTGIVAAGAAANRAWGRFVENVAERYPLAKGIEVWNEPNLATFWGKCPPDPRRYAKLLEFAHDGIERSAHPDTPTVLAGLSAGVDSGPSSWRTYLGRVFSAPRLNGPVRSLFDVMSVHAYRSPEDVANNVGFAAAAGRNVELASAFLAAHGVDEKPVWVTEVGVTDGGPADDSRHVGTADEQANRLRQIYEALRRLDVPVIIIHRFVDSALKVEPPGYGVVTTDLRKKPAYSCLAELNGRPGSCP
jgi:hypothetical protein